ncbi:hypothetical protein [Gemmatimonas sp.]|jgi:hypothetical protein|uniref:hypothetical protein n=1 Tax=Gemmatimonas sp. TaxID=1962908 RepID=UPI0037C0AC5B
MRDLTALPVDMLEAMKAKLLRWFITIAIIDAVVILAFVLVLVLRPTINPVLFVPLLVMPGIVLVPFITRLTAVKKELERRGR